MRFLFLPLLSHSGEIKALSFFLGLTSLLVTTSAEESQSRRSCFDTLAPVFLLPFRTLKGLKTRSTQKTKDENRRKDKNT